MTMAILRITLLRMVLPGILAFAAMTTLDEHSLAFGDFQSRYFQIQVIDRQTGRGVPLVELRTVNNIRYYTDSNGIVAFYEPGLMDRDVFFFVESHGYEFPKDGFGFRGVRLKTSPGGSAIIKIDRLNIAERLYRITGQGIYRDSVLTGHPIPLQNPVLNGQVTGQDSVDTCIYHGRLFWLWGDTSRPSYPLGHFATAGATSALPQQSGLDPAVGINLEYFVDADGFSRPLCRLKEPGMVWLDGLMTVKDEKGQQRMIAKFARMKDLGHAYERGLVVFNDSTQSFEPLLRTGPNLLPYPDFGHTFCVDVDGQRYYYFATPFPLAVRMRVKAEWNYVIDPNRYQVLTALKPEKSNGPGTPRLDLAKDSKLLSWVNFENLTGDHTLAKASAVEELNKEKQKVHLYDIESGKKIIPHSGSVHFNAYRRRWIMIFVQHGGDSSFLGEVWYAEADTPIGPWAYTRKIVTHDKYSFYNPMHHPYFDQDGGRVIFFEGTYSHTFSGSAENATPRYDYNQIMYRLNINDPRLILPVPVYQVREGQNGISYCLLNSVEETAKWDCVESIPFYAIEPYRAGSSLISVYGRKLTRKGRPTTCLTTERPAPSAKPLFCALPPSEKAEENPCIAPLYQYCDDKGRYLYSTEQELREKNWSRAEDPLCRVWKAPPQTPLLDHSAKPLDGR